MELILHTFISFRDYFSHHPVFCVGLLLVAGYFCGKLAEKWKLPSITGYIVAGLLLGESVLGFIPETIADRMNSLTEIALGLIAITIGAEFDIKRMKRSGWKILLMTCFEAVGAAAAVTTAFLLAGMDIKFAMLLGAIAAATAPAATVVIVRQLKAEGEFIQFLYGIVAFDDAVCIILFSVVFGAVGPLLGGTVSAGGGALFSGMLHAFTEIGESLVLGLIGGLVLYLTVRRIRGKKEMMIISLALIFLVTAISIVLHVSLLIANMMLGAVLINISSRNRRIFDSISPLTPPLFALFFILAGAELDIRLFSEGAVVLYGLLYLSSRFAGKYAGIQISGMITRVSSSIRNFLGFCLFPQAGVAIGLVLFLQTSPVLASAPETVKDALVLIVNVVLLSIFINELIGPSVSRFGILKGLGHSSEKTPVEGKAQPEGKHV